MFAERAFDTERVRTRSRVKILRKREKNGESTDQVQSKNLTKAGKDKLLRDFLTFRKKRPPYLRFKGGQNSPLV